MIRKLTIHNIALIESASIDFHDGMIVLSGETGAGKSIIIDAVNLILGGRTDKNLIRAGCDKASVEALFDDISDNTVKSYLDKEGIDFNEGQIVLYRDFSANGRNNCRINGVMVSVSLLKETAAFLINLHGQSEHQFLADENKQLLYLDQLGGESHRKLIEQVRIAYEKFIKNHRYYAKLVKMNETREFRCDQLEHELDELRKTSIQPGEELRLTDETIRLNKASRIHEKLFRTCQSLGNGDENGDSLHNLQSAVRDLRSLGSEDHEFDEIADQCENLYYSLEDLLFRLDSLKQKYDFDPNMLEKAENRLESVRRLMHKYGPTEADVQRNTEALEAEYRTLSELEDLLEKTRKEHKSLLAEYRSAAKELTNARKKIAACFQVKMMNELNDLGMGQTVFEVLFNEESGGRPIMPSPEGDDRIVFMISPNPGEPLKPISKIASGGELSRLMLAIKTIESHNSEKKTMIFDEIDTGISGRIAQAVAEKMMQISRRQQVICISHLPQIASSSDHHFLVYKAVKGDRTFTEISELGYKEHILEIARMISGAQGISEDAKAYAEQLVMSSDKIKERFSV